jgi:hypothetical protein
MALAGFLNPQPLGPVASTLTTTPPRRQVLNILTKYLHSKEFYNCIQSMYSVLSFVRVRIIRARFFLLFTEHLIHKITQYE